MNCTVFWGNNGFVVVPDCLQASVEAEHRHGPLCACARLRTDRLDAPLAERLAAAIDRRSYSCIGADLALHGDYTPTAPLPLPYGFSWQGRDDESAECGFEFIHNDRDVESRRHRQKLQLVLTEIQRNAVKREQS